MTSNRTFVLALPVTTVAAGLAVRRRAQRLEAVRNKTDLQNRKSEGDSPVTPEVVQTPPS